VLELAGGLYHLRLEPVAHAPRKQKAATVTQAPALKKASEKQKCPKVLSRSRDQTSV
jgi:hypothetical protein